MQCKWRRYKLGHIIRFLVLTVTQINHSVFKAINVKQVLTCKLLFEFQSSILFKSYHECNNYKNSNLRNSALKPWGFFHLHIVIKEVSNYLHDVLFWLSPDTKKRMSSVSCLLNSYISSIYTCAKPRRAAVAI